MNNGTKVGLLDIVKKKARPLAELHQDSSRAAMLMEDEEKAVKLVWQPVVCLSDIEAILTEQPPTYTKAEVDKIADNICEMIGRVIIQLDNGAEEIHPIYELQLIQIAIGNFVKSAPDICANSNNTDTETAQRNDTKEPKVCVWKCIDVTNDEYETGCGRNEDYPNPNMKYCGFCGLPIKVEGE